MHDFSYVAERPIANRTTADVLDVGVPDPAETTFSLQSSGFVVPCGRKHCSLNGNLQYDRTAFLYNAERRVTSHRPPWQRVLYPSSLEQLRRQTPRAESSSSTARLFFAELVSSKRNTDAESVSCVFGGGTRTEYRRYGLSWPGNADEHRALGSIVSLWIPSGYKHPVKWKRFDIFESAVSVARVFHAHALGLERRIFPSGVFERSSGGPTHGRMDNMVFGEGVNAQKHSSLG